MEPRPPARAPPPPRGGMLRLGGAFPAPADPAVLERAELLAHPYCTPPPLPLGLSRAPSRIWEHGFPGDGGVGGEGGRYPLAHGSVTGLSDPPSSSTPERLTVPGSHPSSIPHPPP